VPAVPAALAMPRWPEGIRPSLSGFLYLRWGAEGFWVMAALCATALPLTLKLRP
jgi:hypothetical protein